jgi:nanoRNase/pAp phosphatase (c-di-AMP/oligoRNAs hydrolase)
MANSKQKPVPKSLPSTERLQRLRNMIGPEDSLAIVINADPDAMASAIALKRLFWQKVKRILIFHTNVIERGDNLAFVKLLKIDQHPIGDLNPSEITKWSILDSQPGHYESLKNLSFDIVIDHHPLDSDSKAGYMDVRENYGANSTIMTEYLKAAKIRPSPRLATALFYGIKTDTGNFVRASTFNDIKAIRYLYQYTNLNIIKKIESSEMTQKMLASYKAAMERLMFFKDMVIVHMGEVDNPDTLVVIGDFFLRMVDMSWSIVSGIYDNKLIIILRNASFRGNAGKKAQRLFGPWGASAGGHKYAARAEIPLQSLSKEIKGDFDPGRFVLKILKKS